MDYEKFKIKSFNNWEVFLHKNQYPYLGRCYASAIREDAELITDMTVGESEELFFSIVPSWRKTITTLYGNFRPNLAILGNEWPHLHAHMIPRFYDVITLGGVEFMDPNPSGNYSPYPKKELTELLLFEIISDIQSHWE